MPNEALFNPVTGDEVPKIDDAIAVGEDLRFQEKWWRFERAIWIFFLLILIADALGAFGRGWLAKAKMRSDDGSLLVDYERVQRSGTPSILRLRFAPEAVHDGEVKVFASRSLVSELGMQRIIPQPEHSALSDGGIVYTFAANGPSPEVQFELEPSFPGYRDFTVGMPSGAPITAHVVVMP